MATNRSLFRLYIEVVLVAVVLALFVRTFLVQAYTIPSGSMEDSLLVGDHILVNKFIFGPTAGKVEEWLLPQRPVRRGDVVVFDDPKDPTRALVKRCAATGNEVVEIVEKDLFVSGQRILEQYAKWTDRNTYPASLYLHEYLRHRDNFGPEAVPEGHLFFLGDNRDHSQDSRFWGFVATTQVRGRALTVFWSRRPTSSQQPDGQSEATSKFSIFLDSGKRTRWARILHLVR